MRRPLALRAEILHGLHQPAPKYICQNRFTATRAVSGFDGSTSQCARPSRLFGAPAGSGGSTPARPARPSRRAGRRRRAAARASRAASRCPASPSRSGKLSISRVALLAQIEHVLATPFAISSGAYRSRKARAQLRRSAPACAGLPARAPGCSPAPEPPAPPTSSGVSAAR